MPIDYHTAGVEAAHRFDYWSDVVCQHCLPAASRMLTRAPFDGSLRVHVAGFVDVSVMAAPLHNWSRQARHIRMRDDDDLWLGYMRAGEGVLEQGGRQARLLNADLVLYDAGRPFDCTLTAQSLFLCRFPRRALLQRHPGADRMTARTFDTARPGVAPLRAMIELAACLDGPRLRQQVGGQFDHILLDLLGLALEFQCDMQPRPAERDLHARVWAYIEKNFMDPELCLQSLAQAHGVSARTVTRAFARHRQSPMGRVWQLRLEASRQALLEGRARSVTEAAFDHGFSDLSHFSQAFRKSFGVQPSTLLRGR